MSRCRNDHWGKVLLMSATLFLVAPCLLHGLMRVAHPHMHGPGAAPPHHRPEHQASLMERPPSDRSNAHSLPLSKERNFDGSKAVSEDKDSSRMPPMFHHELHHIVLFMAVASVSIAFLSPSRLRSRLSAALLVALLLASISPQVTLSRYASAGPSHCSAIATRHVTTYMFMSVSVGPFEAISVVQAPSVKTVDTEVLLECSTAIEHRVRFVGSLLWMVMTVLLAATTGLAVSDAKRFSGGEKADAEEECTTDADAVAPTVFTSASCCVIDEESILIPSPIQPLHRQSTIPYVTVDTLEQE